MRRTALLLLAIVLAALLLAGCGGTVSSGGSKGDGSGSGSGGGTGTITTTPGEAQGVYAGTYSWGQSLYAIVLPDDMFYSIEGEVAIDGSFDHVHRLVSGQGESSGGRYKAELTAVLIDYTFGLSLDATYVPGASLAGSMSPPPTSTFSATMLPVSQFEFKTPADVSEVAGTWTGVFLHHAFDEPAIGTIAISPEGEITSVGTNCSYSGTVTPDAQKNFFNVTITFGAAPCAAPNQTISGVAIEMLLPNGATRQLLVVMKQSTFGFAAMR